MWDDLHGVRDLPRAYAIASILVRYGGAGLVRRVGLAAALAKAGRLLSWDQLSETILLSAPVRARKAMEDLGPTFVKLGQVLATRVDLFEPEWISEFERLQSHARAVPIEEILAQLTQDLGAPPAEVFAFFDEKPLAAASIAQVHRARLIDGTEVIIKIRRPGIRALVEADLRLLRRAAIALEAHFPELAYLQPRALVEQFRVSLLGELDLAVESRNAERIAASFVAYPELLVPRIYWDYTSERVNVQDYVAGIPVGDLDALRQAGIDCKSLARKGAQMVLKMLLEDGFFHADPHPGNVFALADGRIALIDYGMVGKLSATRKGEVVALLYGLVNRDAEAVTEALLGWTHAATQVDESLLAGDIDSFIGRYHGVPLGRLNLAAMLLEITVILRAHALSLPADLALMIKVCLTLEGLGRALDPDFDMAGQSAPFLRSAMRARFSPGALARQSSRTLALAAHALSELPRVVRRLLRAASTGNVRISVEVEALQQLGAQLDHSANRLTMGVVIAALVVGSSITMTVAGGPRFLGLPFFGLLGFVGAVLAGIWLVWSIWRSGGGK